MDMKACVKELPQELARELLIAISNSVPEKHPSPDKHLPQRFDNANGVAVTNGDEAEKYRIRHKFEECAVLDDCYTFHC
ncbi:hypothetical protein CISIN_1g034726mg [Citrus sinensis]|uniref:Uncharacterized protein n=1 Tax=Citrus sinensis TaxID=2711 RepID=A0A067E1K6_CITSI|nr:hypothetical protein CISIN_1g034726mg [Citrus sinensis]